MTETKIPLSGGALYLTEDPSAACRVDSGRVLVFVLPVREGRPGRRQFLYEAAPGELVPAFCCTAPADLHDDAPCGWRFGLAAMEKAELAVLPGAGDETLRADFAGRARMRNYALLGFDECVLEFYRLEAVRSLRNIYKTEQEQKRSYQQGLEVIYDLFRRGRAAPRAGLTGSPLYDAAAVLCRRMGIPIAPLDTVRAASGRRFALCDIARVSHFACRDILLEDGWWRSDAGPFLAFTEAEGAPVACLPKGPRAYVACDPATGVTRRIDAAYAATLSPQAQMLYRPLPNRAVGLGEMLRFGLQGVYTGDVVRLLVLALLGTLVGLLLPALNRQVYDLFIPLGDAPALLQAGGVVLACTLGNIGFLAVKNLAHFRSVNTMKYALQSAVYDRLFSLPQSFLRSYDSADLAMRAMGVSAVVQIVSAAAVSAALSAVFSLLYLWQMYSCAPRLLGISLGMVLSGAGVIVLLGYRQIRYEREKAGLDGRLSSLLHQQIGGIAKLRIAGVEDHALYEYLRPYTESRRLSMRAEKLAVWSGALKTAMPVVFSMALYAVIVRGGMELSTGAFMGFYTAFGAFSAAMLELAASCLTVNNTIPLFERLKPILQTLPEVPADSALPGELSGEMEVSHVTFAYDEDRGPVLHDLSLQIHEGEFVGIVGASGCGKSTLLRLLLGFERPQAGRIYYDGRDIETMDKRELRKKFGVVLQNDGLIAGSIYDNIVITAPKTPLKRVQEIVREVGLAEDIARMPMGLHTIVAEGGGTISGGQRQRILIARAIAGAPKILFFDEATSALDNVTQAQVCDTLEKLRATRIVIAHRLSTVMRCDRILVMDAGRIAEQGSYEQLMAQKGLFYRLASRQIE